MTNFRIEQLAFSSGAVTLMAASDARHTNWPVVYTLDDGQEIYVGESLNVVTRMRQHLDSPEKDRLKLIRVVVDDTFNKSVCLDLESYLIRLLAGDSKYRVLNRNEGITNADYFGRAKYQETFNEIFEELFHAGVFTRTIPQIENGDLFKLSPFKALNHDQATAIVDILEGLFHDIKINGRSTTVIQGDPGTGKTIIAIYLIKLIQDIATTVTIEHLDKDSIFSDFFVEENRKLLEGFRIAFVVPQQSLRASIQKVFHKTPGLHKDMVLTPFEVGESDQRFDLIIVDETHRLNQRANQPSAAQNRKFAEINAKLFGADDNVKTQADWITAQSNHQIFLLDPAQTIRPADLPRPVQAQLLAQAKRPYRLLSQMRVRGGVDYIEYIRKIFGSGPPNRQTFVNYEFRLYDDLSDMYAAILQKEKEVGLARLVAGFAWPWKSKTSSSVYDIEIDECQLRWNTVARDWINSPRSIAEVGSIHTVQGYDLNYAGVIVGLDLRYDPVANQLVVDRDSYHDKKGKENNPRLGVRYTDDDLLRFITNIYGVLCTRGIMGTYLYICDPQLRQYIRRFVTN